MKICSKCKEEKAKISFPKRKDSKDGYGGKCLVCEKAYRTGYYLNNKEAAYLQSTLWHKSPKGKARGRVIHLRTKYGITPEIYTELFELQKGYCLICNRHQTELKRTLVVDHCHNTCTVRGLLCSSCNSAIGLLQDSSNITRAATAYLENNNK